MLRWNRRSCGVGFFVVALVVAAPAATAAQPGEATYAATCAGCHDGGAAGAPVLRDAGAWRARLTQSRATLRQHALHGWRNMPPKGGNSWLSDADVSDAVSYMLANIGNDRAQPSVASNVRTSASRASPPSDNEIPPDKYGEEVRLGKRIFTETYRYARRYSGNDLACSNCHLDAGRRANAAPLWAAYGMYPAYRAKLDRNDTFEERIQQCFRFSLNGISPALDAPEVRAIVAYAHFLARGVPVGIEQPGRGFVQVLKTGSDPSPARGEVVYKNQCVACHGPDGQGKTREEGGYAVPPLWGRGAYNRGAGFGDSEKLAGFVLANMPPASGKRLDNQQALDVAAFINLQWRPADPRHGLLGGLLK